MHHYHNYVEQMNYRGYKLTNYVYYYCVYWYRKDEPQNYHDCYYCVRICCWLLWKRNGVVSVPKRAYKVN